MLKPSAKTALLAFCLISVPLALCAQDKPAEKSEQPTEHRSSSSFDSRITDCRKQPTRFQVSDCTAALSQTRTIFLNNVSQQNDANEILVAVRNMFDPSVKVYLVQSQNAISISTYPEEFDRIQALIKTLDLPHKTFRLTYTITDVDGDKRVGTQHFSMVMVDGQRSTLKQGSKIPVATGKSDDGKGTPGSIETNFTYLDVGINIDATLTAHGGGARLLSKVEQSSVAPEPAVIAGVSEPIIRQSVLAGTLDIGLSRPVVLGSVDIVGSTHHLDISVSADPLQ